MPYSLRTATAADQPAITAIIRQAQLNPRDLDWPRFILAESEGRVIGVGQVKPHGDGSRELASIAVVPEFQGQGIGSAICRALIERESGTLFLMSAADKETYYARFGFHKIGQDEATSYFKRILRIAGALRPLMQLLRDTHLIVMKRPAEG